MSLLSTSSLVTVKTTDVVSDTNFLRKWLAQNLFLQRADDSEETSLSDHETRRTTSEPSRERYSEVHCTAHDTVILLIQSEQVSQQVIWGLAPETHALLLETANESTLSSSVTTVTIGSYSCLELSLPSGASMLLLPHQVTKETTQKLAYYLAHPATSHSDALQNNGQHVSTTSKATTNNSNNNAILQPTIPFPLRARLMLQHDAWYDDFPINHREPIPFETNLFVGKLVFLLRPIHSARDDPYHHEKIFSRKKRRMILQLQGKFKYTPTKTLYAGAEVSHPMQLGLITKGVCNMLLQLVRRFQQNVHYSFGKEQGGEKAHIVVPAYSFFERIVVTKPQQTPPAMDVVFDESAESMTARKKNGAAPQGFWNTTDTFSFSSYSMYIDLAQWQLVNLPFTGDVGLSTFWGNSSLNICLYEQNSEAKKHLANRYVFCLNLEHGKRFWVEEMAVTDESEEDDDAMDIVNLGPSSLVRFDSSADSTTRKNESCNGMTRSESNVLLQIADDDEASEYFFDAAAEESAHYDEEDYGEVSEQTVMIEQTNSRVEVSATLGHGQIVQMDRNCPCWYNIWTGRGGYRKHFVLVSDGDNRLFLCRDQDCENVANDSHRDTSRRVKEAFSPRLSNTERLRRTMGLILFESSTHNVQTLLQKSSSVSEFLRRAPPSTDLVSGATITVSSCVGRALSDRQWIEEWAVAYTTKLSFWLLDKRKPHFQVRGSEILDCRLLAANENQLIPNTFMLAISTIGRTMYLMFCDENVCHRFHSAVQDMMSRFQQQLQPEETGSLASTDSLSVSLLTNPADEFLHKSSIWNCKNRRLLNCAEFALTNQSFGRPEALSSVETTLRMALSVVQEEATADSTNRRAFLRHAAQLRNVNLYNLSEDERVVFFLNLYHTMILHAFLVLGRPDSSLKWLGYFNNFAYQVSDDIFSLAELEHCIIRSRMSYPSQFLSRFVIPKSLYRFALTRSDFRINFALNCGSRSNPSSILVYQLESLSRQLDIATRLYLKTVEVRNNSSGRDVVTLPRICQWFRDDFGDSDTAMVKRLQSYFPYSVADADSVSIRYLSYQFECRVLELYEEDGQKK